MSSYRVTDVRPQLRLAALRDAMGKNHVVNLGAEAPEIGAQLEGPTLRARQSALLADNAGQVFDVTVDALECPEQYVLERLHAALQEPAQRRPLPPEAEVWLPPVPAARSN